MSTPAPRPICEIHKLWTVFGRNIIHQDLELTINAGEVVSLVGGSGSGKTTLLRHIVGLTQPTRGEVLLFGKNLHAMDRVPQQRLMNRLGMLFQQGALFSALSVFDNIAFPLRELRQFNEATIRQLVLHKLSLVEMEPDAGNRLPSQLSGGMIKRVALARALALEPELLLLDEPTAGLDPERSENFVELIKQIKHALGLTVIFVTHDLDTLVSLSDKVAVLADQRIVANCSLQELGHIDHPFVQNFFQGIRVRLERTG
ncbi:phospholipid/cholesterol/gamma-HCH transport system ATP-binding protein [Methylobacillus rhizosphaerae]|uniref:Phospholipid/cholesterol/gamma-HCH transport system ATP-binding protein n=1 Tax=Methylobacillus rhizosphaerae TaxID=551994 RepID=A0A238XUM3_9PROT|nr:ATP-binding cassette domain-containing protein [Methylobacillus rhizosphaerae]SNR62390.1 phospholipid/cholesterol/gamma-HCH transport system ATP-binding protein [Methylobacillus rhizosphaerae]